MRLAVLTEDPAPVPPAQHHLLARLGRGAELHLDIDPLGLGAEPEAGAGAGVGIGAAGAGAGTHASAAARPAAGTRIASGAASEQQFLLQRLPVGGVVDVGGEVAFGGAEPPREAPLRVRP